MLLQNQLNNNNNHKNNDNDPQAAMAKKLAALKAPQFIRKEDPMLVENWVHDFDKIFTAAGSKRKVIGAGTAATYKEAYNRACNIERILKREQEVKDRHKRKGKGESSSNHQSYDKRPRLGGNSIGNGGNGQHEGRNSKIEVGHKKFEFPKKHIDNNQAQNGQGNNSGNNGGGYVRNSNYNNRFNNKSQG
ncbi:SWI5-dependent HO expression protein 3-like [Chenopodium quinoa]|uniref:SWI5-dependent HO expression protein 3-like n=1 Tax=Chenopodium quinoa TaxID=63459 RepID=UPI000B78F00B|nr:SWI5-dependent HO expression protein 3-like [Chenopodium quinoa]